MKICYIRRNDYQLSLLVLKNLKLKMTLIPSKGRNLQCGSCNYNWFYKIENKTVEPLKLEENIEEKIEDSDESVLISSNSEVIKDKIRPRIR
jgi:hypothetical protein